MERLVRDIFEGATPEFGEVVDAWGELFPLLNRLEETPQDPVWHGEGNVLIHTTMVLEETYRRLAEIDLSRERRLILILGAVFHDIAKPLTTRHATIDGVERIVAPRHAEKGASYLATPILELGLSGELARQVLALVAYHHAPKQLVIKESPGRSYRRLARLADMELLYHLEQADMRGRHCPDLQEQIDCIDLFGLFAKEEGVFGEQLQARKFYAPWWDHIGDALADFDERTREFVFARALREAEAGEIYTAEEAVAKSFGYREAFPELVVLCGPSGSGKTTWAREHLPGHHRVSMDDIRMELTGDVADQSHNDKVRALAKERLKEHLRARHKIVWDATNLRRDFRGLPLGLGEDYGAFTTLVVFHHSKAKLHRQNQARRAAVPTSILDRQLQSMQWPSLDEAHEVVFVEG